MRRRPELAVDREPEHLPVETLAALDVGRSEQDAAAEYLHGSNMPCRGARRGQLSSSGSRMLRPPTPQLGADQKRLGRPSTWVWSLWSG
ncbi:hypothetical protein Ais01nite_05040 [Asanoa ishikariensis]|nr:hypothetical protein Ais01nite_05040 [Asanoa ishikariensis]